MAPHELAARLSLLCDLRNLRTRNETWRQSITIAWYQLLAASKMRAGPFGVGLQAPKASPRPAINVRMSRDEWVQWAQLKNLCWQPFQQYVNNLRISSGSDVNARHRSNHMRPTQQAAAGLVFLWHLPVSTVGAHKRHCIHYLVDSHLSCWQRMSKVAL
jgi:hypothetical protein